MATAVVSLRDAGEVVAAERAAIIALCEAAFDEPFDRLFDLLPGSRHLLVHVGDRLVSHGCWVTRWLQPTGLPALRTAYVEAVATFPECEGRGYGTLVMARIAEETGRYDLRALSPAVPEFYARRGWEVWRGPTAIRADGGLLATPGEEIMIARTARTPPLDLDATISAEWREGELW